MIRSVTWAIAAAAILGLTACSDNWMPGKPRKEDEWKPPTAILDFHTLYTQNCLGCHSDGTSVSPSNSMRDPLYLSILPEAELRDVISNGREGTLMPKFLVSNGGLLTEEQVDVLVKGISAWAEESPPAGPFPPYSAPLGDAIAGGETFGVFCGSCHGADGTGAEAGAVIQSAYLGLVSDQYIRTITMAGRPELGCPSYRDRVPGRAMTDVEIADVVAWISSQRKPGPAEPPGLGERN